MSKKRKNKNLSNNKANKKADGLIRDIKSLFSEYPGRNFTVRQVIKTLGIRDKISKNMVPDILFELAKNEGLEKRRNSFVNTTTSGSYTGTVDHVNPKFAYVIIPGHEEDVWVKTSDLMGAIDGDTVALIIKPKKHGLRPEGKVTEIIKRGREEFVGRLESSANFAFLVPDNRKIHTDFFIYPEKTKGAKDNDKVIARVYEWNTKNKSPLAEVVNVLGPAGENEAEIHSIMAEFDLPFDFPEKVTKAAEKIPVEITDKETRYRKDFRNVTTFTIDPEDAKDFDDALSLRKTDKGNWEVGIHIADVTHYVKPDTSLETEAYDRATSVYLVDRTIPMLPEKLSNALCSLRPNEEKLTFSAVFELNDKAEVLSQWFGKTVIYSDRRFTYEEAQERIESGEGDFADEIIQLNDLARLLRKYRFQNGAINFETVEVKFKLDEKGKPLGVIPKVRKDAHKMIEEFMLLANKKVAEFIHGKRKSGEDKTFVYRTHDLPDPEKLDNFAKFASRFGHKIQLEGGNISRQLNKLMSDIEQKPEQNVLESLAIRSMAKAKYTTEPKGHFGLAFDHYTHFTSPIRRYPDMMVHRLLQHYLDGGKPVDKKDFEERCSHSSEREKRAADAERASIKYKQVEFMSSVLGETFDGIVSGVTEWGIFVEITETKCEGMIKISDLTDDYYDFDEKSYRIVGRRNKRIITLGDKLKVQIARTDNDRRTIDLDLVEE